MIGVKLTQQKLDRSGFLGSQAMLVVLYHVASFSHCWQEAPEREGYRRGPPSGQWGRLFGMRAVVGLRVLGETGESRRRGRVWRSPQGQWRGQPGAGEVENGLVQSLDTKREAGLCGHWQVCGLFQHLVSFGMFGPCFASVSSML